MNWCIYIIKIKEFCQILEYVFYKNKALQKSEKLENNLWK